MVAFTLEEEATQSSAGTVLELFEMGLLFHHSLGPVSQNKVSPKVCSR